MLPYGYKKEDLKPSEINEINFWVKEFERIIDVSINDFIDDISLDDESYLRKIADEVMDIFKVKIKNYLYSFEDEVIVSMLDESEE